MTVHRGLVLLALAALFTAAQVIANAVGAYLLGYFFAAPAMLCALLSIRSALLLHDRKDRS